jgi:hypothetical protein
VAVLSKKSCLLLRSGDISRHSLALSLQAGQLSGLSNGEPRATRDQSFVRNTVPVTGGVASSDSYADTNHSTYESSQVKDAMTEATRKAITSFIRRAWADSEKRPWFLGEFVNLFSFKQSRQGVLGDLDKANS